MLNQYDHLINENENEKKSYLNDISLVKELFIMIISELKESLELKYQLLSFKNFFPDILFLKLDYFSKKNICAQDILHYLEGHNYKLNNEVIRRFIKHYDKHGNMNLIYEDFLNFISPPYKNINYCTKNRKGNIDNLFCDILIKECKLIGFIGEMILKIRKNNKYDCNKIFIEISRNSKNLNNKILYEFLDEKFNENEINELIYFIDSNNNGLISYEDFHDLLIPIKRDFESERNNDEIYLTNNYLKYNDLDNLNSKQMENIEEDICLYKVENNSELMANKENNNCMNNQIVEIKKADKQKLSYNKNIDENNNNYNIIEDNKKENKDSKDDLNDFEQKISIEEKEIIQDLKENNFPFTFGNNKNYYYIRDNNLNNNNIYPSFENFKNKNEDFIIRGEPAKSIKNYKDNINFIQKENNNIGLENAKEINSNIINDKKNAAVEEMNYYINKYLINDLNFNVNKFKNNNQYKGYNKEKNACETVNKDNKKIKKYLLEEKIKGETSNKNDSIDRLDRGDINLFLEYINLIIIYENKIEEIKENLSLREDLSLKEIFLLFDKEQKNYISPDNFQLICKNVFNLFPTIDQVKLVFKRYKRILAFNKDDNIILNLEDFYQMLIPEKIEYINIVERKNTIDKTNIRLTKKSKNILTQLIKLLIQKETSYYKIKNKLNKPSLENIWKEIAKFSNHEGKIYKKEMKKFFEEYDYFLNKNQIDIIFSMFDKEKKGVINDNDFLEEMSY